MDEKKEFGIQLSIAVPNGIIIGLIGLLVLLTPLTTGEQERVEGGQLVMDIVAGGVLTVGGMVSLVWGLHISRRRLKQSEP